MGLYTYLSVDENRRLAMGWKVDTGDSSARQEEGFVLGRFRVPSLCTLESIDGKEYGEGG